jgi:hypothetical protein
MSQSSNIKNLIGTLSQASAMAGKYFKYVLGEIGNDLITLKTKYQIFKLNYGYRNYNLCCGSSLNS